MNGLVFQRHSLEQQKHHLLEGFLFILNVPVVLRSERVRRSVDVKQVVEIRRAQAIRAFVLSV